MLEIAGYFLPLICSGGFVVLASMAEAYPRPMTKLRWISGMVLACFATGCGGDDDKKKGSGDGGGGSSGWQAAVGDEGTFVQTFDGKTWATRTLTPMDLYSVTCVGNMDGWAAGENGYVARTRDGLRPGKNKGGP